MAVEAQENSDLLNAKDKIGQNGNTRNEEESSAQPPPDGGVRAYAVVIAAFLTNGLIFGVMNSCSVIYTVLEKQLKDDGVANAESQASLVGSLAIGTIFFLSPISGVLTGLLGLRLTAILGGLIAATGALISSFCSHNVNALYFTYGIMYGIGASFAYTPSLAILGHYFKKYLGIVNGFVCIGSSVFTVIMGPLMKYMLEKNGLPWLFRLVAGLSACIALCGFIFKPVALVNVKKPREYNSCKSFLATIIDYQIWKNRKYRLWALFMPIALFGYFVFYVHIEKFMKESFKNVNLLLPLQVVSVSSGIGRLAFGYLADRPNIDRIMLQQISFYIFGTLTIIMPFVKSFPLLIFLSLGIGICDGAFIALIGPIAFEFCGEHAAQGIGCMLGMAAPCISLGPVVAGYLYKVTQSYKLPFILAGISPLIGSTLMFAIRFQCRRTTPPTSNGHVIPMTSSDTEKSPTPLLTSNGNANQH